MLTRSNVIKYISQARIELPNINDNSEELPIYSSDVRCRVKVDAMGETEQDCILVIDWNNIESTYYEKFVSVYTEATAISNADGKYTDSSYNGLASKLEKYSSVVKYDKKHLFTAIKDINKTIDRLVVSNQIISNGTYLIPTTYLKVNEVTHYYDNSNVSYGADYEVTDEKYDFLNQFFGDNIEVTVNNGKYGLKLSVIADSTDNYYISNIAGFAGVLSRTSLSTRSRTQHLPNDETVWIFSEGSYLDQKSKNYLDNIYDANELILKFTMYTKDEFVQEECLVGLKIDWENAVEKIDKTNLQTLIEYVDVKLSSMSLDNYTDSSVTTFNDAYNNAKEVLLSDSVKQSDVNSAQTQLSTAFLSLEEKPTVDTTALETKIAEAEAISNADGKYTAESYAGLTTAVESAKAVLADESKTQESVDNAATAVQTAVDGLVEVVPEELTLTATLDNDKITFGTKFTVNAAAAGGAGDYTYAVLYKKISDEKWVTKQKYSENATVQIKPAKAEQYMICVKAKDADGTIAKKYFIADVENTLKNTSTIPNPTIKLGERMAINVSSEGGIGEHTYAVYYKKVTDTKWIAKQSYSTNTDVSIKPAYAAQYMVCVKVKDSNGVVEKKYFMANVE